MFVQTERRDLISTACSTRKETTGCSSVQRRAARKPLIMKRQENRKVPAELLPVCPRCGSPLTMNLRCDDRFVEDACWHRAAERYESFLRTRAGQRMLFLELGVGYNTPGIIKYPFWRMTARNPKATYACINLGEVGAPPEIKDRSILLSEDIGAALQALREA